MTRSEHAAAGTGGAVVGVDPHGHTTGARRSRRHAPPESGAVLPVILVLFICALLLPAPCPALETAVIDVGDNRLTVEVADDPLERSLGLMYRDALPEDRGMLFVYPDEEPRSFWMKNTRIPLSIAFADKSGVIIAVMDMFPDDGAARYRSPGPAMYALEMNRGWFKRHNVTVGDRIRVGGGGR